MAKKRVEIPPGVAAQVLFSSDRTCCVCRVESKPVQIHHLDEDPANNDRENLAVLCFDCHRETQIHGGFDRKLDAEQVHLYRDDWHVMIASRRASHGDRLDKAPQDVSSDIELATSLVEIHREQGDWVGLALLYDSLGNEELRDRYIEKALDELHLDTRLAAFLRSKQGTLDAIPGEEFEAELDRLAKPELRLERARLLVDARRYGEAAHDYIRGILRSLDEGRVFTAAFYLREIVTADLITALYVEAFERAAEGDDLWWQVRVLQDLGWTKQLYELVLDHEDTLAERAELDEEQILELRGIAAEARDDRAAFLEVAKQRAKLDAATDWNS